MRTRLKSDIAAIIPARGGSKGIPLKNIQPLAGKPLLAFTIEAALQSGSADVVIVSTDSTEIAKVALHFGAEVIKRPAEISGDRAPTEAALIHTVKRLEEERGWVPECVLTLQPTSPLRSAKTIREFVSRFRAFGGQYDAMLSLSECHGDYWARDSEGQIVRLFPNAPRRRQDRDPIYLENSALYITRTQALVKTNSALGTRCTGFVIDDIEAVDINTPLDLAWAEFLLRLRRDPQF